MGKLVKAGELSLVRDLSLPKETKDARDLPAPDKSEFENRKINLFQTFLSNTEEEQDQLSNAVEFWDSVPRYSVSRQAMTKARAGGRFLEKYTIDFQHRGRSYTCVISPARITDHDGVERDYYPSATEELVEHALRKLASEQQAGYFDKPKFRSGVVFTLYQLEEELKKQGHGRSYPQLVEALNILSQCSVAIISDGDKKGALVSSCLPTLAVVSREDLATDPEAKWTVQFHPLVTGGIDKVTYRQFNYRRMMSLKAQLARWLHQQLVLKYTFANLQTPFEMRYSTVKRDSGLLDGYKLQRMAVAALEEAFGELAKGGVIMGAERQDIYGQKRKIHDVVFQVRPSADFVKEAKAANRRHTAGIESDLSAACGKPPSDRVP
jgi:hypothetical protein